MLLQPRMAAFLLLAALTAVLFDGLALRGPLDLPLTGWLWSSTLVLHVLARLALDTLWARGQARFGLWRIYQPLLWQLAFGLDMLQFNAQLALFSGVSFAAAFDAARTVLGDGLMIVGELFFGIFVMPVLLHALPARPAPRAAEIPPPRQISVGGELIPIDTLLLLKSRAHHVEILQDGGALHRRARLIDLVNQTAPEDGVFAHRSHWVARRAIAGLTIASGPGTDLLVLTTGERLPVAGPRRAAVRDWVRRNLPELRLDAAE